MGGIRTHNLLINSPACYHWAITALYWFANNSFIIDMIFTHQMAHTNNFFSISPMGMGSTQYKLIWFLLVRWRMPIIRSSLIWFLLSRWRIPAIPLALVPWAWDQRCINWFDFYSPDGKQVINELVKFIKESLPFIALSNR